MNCTETEKQDDLVFRCKECEFCQQNGTCLVKKFVLCHKHYYPLKDFGSMGELGGMKRMNENKIIEMLGDIRYEMFNILEGDILPKVLLVIDEKMDLYRGKSNEDIAKELIKND